MRKKIILILGMVVVGLTACGGNETVSDSNTVEVMKNIEIESSEVEESSHNVDASYSNADNGDISTEQQRDNEQSLTDNVSIDVQGQDIVTDIDANDGEYLETETGTITTETQQAEQSEKAVAEQPKAEQAKQVVAEQPQVEQSQPVIEQPSVEQSQQTVVEQPSVEQQSSVIYDDNTDHVGFDGINPYTGQPWKEGDIMPSGAIFQGDNTAAERELFGF